MKTDAIKKCIELAFVDSDRCNSDTTILQAAAAGELEAIETTLVVMEEALKAARQIVRDSQFGSPIDADRVVRALTIAKAALSEEEH